MEITKNFDLDRAVASDAVLELKPQVRFLWQNAAVHESLKNAATDRFKVPFEDGYDGLNMHQARRKESGWWSLVATKGYCRLDFGDEEGLRKGFDFWLDQLQRTADGRFYIPKERWTDKNGKVVKKMKKIDMHIHTYGDISMDQKVAYMKEMMDLRGYCGLGFMGCLRNSVEFHLDSNEVTMELKRRIPGCFAFAGLDHGKDFVEQAKLYMEQGFDGIKMLEGKPSLYRFWGTGYEGPRMDEFFAYAEAQDIPLVIHNNDPRANWDPSHPKADHLRAKGWYYGDGDVPSQEEFFQMMEGVLERHPNLRVALSHMGFYYDNLPRVSALMDKYPNLYMDLTPAVEVFIELSLTPEATREFIHKYSKRMFIGTDTNTNWAPGSRVREFNDQKVRMMEVFFEGDEPEVVGGKYPVAPMHIEPEILEDIYYYNALRFMKKI